MFEWTAASICFVLSEEERENMIQTILAETEDFTEDELRLKSHCDLQDLTEIYC